MPKHKITTPELELKVRAEFNISGNIIAPNIYWGWDLLYEADIVVITKSHYAYEIELKVSKADLKADSKKRHGHNDYHNRFKYLYFAMPEEIYEAELVPERAGVLLLVSKTDYNGNDTTYLRTERWPTKNKDSRKVTDKEYLKLLELCHHRVWMLKRHLCKKMLEINKLKERT